MTTKQGFTKMSISEFEDWISNLTVSRTILNVQEHHTWNPDYDAFNQQNHFELQSAMKQYHVSNNGWMDIGQHFTTFPDGTVLTGRSMEQSPACIFGFNSSAVCIENLGNFDTNKDVMTVVHKDAIVRLTAALCRKFNIPVNTDRVVYHHWFNLVTGARNNGTGNNKTCPGTNFFGGNTVTNCRDNFLPLVEAVLSGQDSLPIAVPEKYALVTSDTLNVRQGPGVNNSVVPDVEPVVQGSVLRIFEVSGSWYKISGSKQRWVNGKYTSEVIRATVKASSLNVRSGPGTSYSKIASVKKGQEVFIAAEENGWSKITPGDQWVSSTYLDKHI